MSPNTCNFILLLLVALALTAAAFPIGSSMTDLAIRTESACAIGNGCPWARSEDKVARAEIICANGGCPWARSEDEVARAETACLAKNGCPWARSEDRVARAKTICSAVHGCPWARSEDKVAHGDVLQA
ncbi:hypothetical protein LZ554_001951 [Drepanopeziza brunnea f. sp. 'monogermtubi']|nr:hypothetical protein LZ554_001951 [Drepanopeziza brunnea f. sp. 'monogermtubi']